MGIMDRILHEFKGFKCSFGVVLIEAHEVIPVDRGRTRRTFLVCLATDAI